MKRDTVLLMLELEPSRAQPENQPAAADDIHRRRHLGQHGRMAVGVAGYHQAEADPPGSHRQRGERGPALETRPRGIGKDGQEMIEAPGSIVAQAIDLLPEREERRPAGVLLRRLDAEADGMGHHFSWDFHFESSDLI